MEKNKFYVSGDDSGRRLDKVLRKMLPEVSLGMIYKLLRKKEITLNGKKADPAEKTNEGDIITLRDLRLLEETAIKNEEQGQKQDDRFLKKYIIYENKHILAINKPRGLVTHGQKSLDDIVGRYLGGKLKSSLSFKPGPINRLDRNTTGLLFFSCSLEGAQGFTELFKNRECEKYYLAICDGQLTRIEVWEDKLERNEKNKTTIENENGRTAKTKVIPIVTGKRHTLVLFKIFTGRTHQIRAQSALHGYPLTGDKKYQGSPLLPQYMLHSSALRLKGKNDLVNFQFLTAPLPKSAEVTIKNVFNAGALKRIEEILKRELKRKKKGWA